MDVDELQRIMLGEEGEQCEFKEAQHNFNSDHLVEYCVALANEQGLLAVANYSASFHTGLTSLPLGMV
jgi:hypothetical protein